MCHFWNPFLIFCRQVVSDDYQEASFLGQSQQSTRILISGLYVSSQRYRLSIICFEVSSEILPVEAFFEYQSIMLYIGRIRARRFGGEIPCGIGWYWRLLVGIADAPGLPFGRYVLSDSTAWTWLFLFLVCVKHLLSLSSKSLVTLQGSSIFWWLCETT